MDLFTVDSNVMNHLLPDTAVYSTPAPVTIRQAQMDDVDLILEMHQRLSPDSLYNRYHSPRLPTKEEIEKICALDSEHGRALVAVHTRVEYQIVGMAYYVKTAPTVADTAFLVEDRFQGQGIGRRLMQQLSQLAVVRGIRFFDALVLPANQRMIYLLHHTGQLVYNRLDFGAREMRVQLGTI